jgi:uncharacterized protein with HEPN domain
VSSRKLEQRLQDILTQAEETLAFTMSLDFESFCADTRTVKAVLYNLAVIGEAAASLLPDVLTVYPDLPWEDMRAMRNITIHEYFRVNLEIIWITVCEDIPPLIDQIKALTI